MKSVAYLMEQCTLKWKGIESFYCIMDVVPNMDVVPIINGKRNFSRAASRSNDPSGDKFKNSLVYLAHPQLGIMG